MTYKIMIVDDQFVSREMFKLYIDQCPDYKVLYCIDTAMFADTYVLKDDLDLVIMDILMEDGSNGLDAAEKIKKIKARHKNNRRHKYARNFLDGQGEKNWHR